ncbi:MAG TPA: FAD-dependent oxidoreductase [Chloroflexota bacterium]|nr:FAD-dependent oxidoreductase [Chloroflexota bacterium]
MIADSAAPNAHPADLIVVGSGVAGLWGALTAAESGARVTLLCAGELLSGSSARAQGGVAAALGADDTPELHAQDTLRVGAELNDIEVVRVLTREGAEIARRLLGIVPFDGAPDHPDLALEAAHSRRRVLHAGGGATGRVVSAALIERVRATPGIQVCEHARVQRLPRQDGSIRGVQTATGSYRARAVMLATGGYAALWARTTNDRAPEGFGLSLAWEAGASLADLELVQFHPTALDLPGRPAYLLSEAIRGEGAQVVDAAGSAVIDALLPRDRLSRAVERFRRERGPVFLSLRHLDPAFVRLRFASIAQNLAGWGIDLAADLVPISPAAHFCMGGVRTDDRGRTDLPGLYAAGEVSCTGVHGGNRLASNSLLECLVFGQRAALAALTDAPGTRATWRTGALPESSLLAPEEPDGAPLNGQDDPGLPEFDRAAGIERVEGPLRRLLARLPNPDDSPLDRQGLAALVVSSALLRRESRGSHYRADAPETNPAWRGHIHVRRGAAPAFEPLEAVAGRAGRD